jgi:hypothetical protein
MKLSDAWKALGYEKDRARRVAVLERELASKQALVGGGSFSFF